MCRLWAGMLHFSYAAGELVVIVTVATAIVIGVAGLVALALLGTVDLDDPD